MGRRDRFHPKIVEIGAILAIFKLFQFLKIHMPLLGEFSRSSQNSCESDYDSHKSWDDRLNSPKSGGCQKVSGKLFTQKNKIDTATLLAKHCYEDIDFVQKTVVETREAAAAADRTAGSVSEQFFGS